MFMVFGPFYSFPHLLHEFSPTHAHQVTDCPIAGGQARIFPHPRPSGDGLPQCGRKCQKKNMGTTNLAPSNVKLEAPIHAPVLSTHSFPVHW